MVYNFVLLQASRIYMCSWMNRPTPSKEGNPPSRMIFFILIPNTDPYPNPLEDCKMILSILFSSFLVYLFFYLIDKLSKFGYHNKTSMIGTTINISYNYIQLLKVILILCFIQAKKKKQLLYVNDNYLCTNDAHCNIHSILTL